MGDVFDSRTAGSSTSLDLDTLVLFQAGVELVFETLFAPSRVERLAQQATFYGDSNQTSLPTLDEVLAYTYAQLFQPTLPRDVLAQESISQALLISQAAFYNTLVRLERGYGKKLSMVALSAVQLSSSRFRTLDKTMPWCQASDSTRLQCLYMKTQVATKDFIGNGDTVRLPNGPPI